MAFDVKFEEDDVPGKNNDKITVNLPSELKLAIKKEIPTDQFYKLTRRFWLYTLNERRKQKAS